MSHTARQMAPRPGITDSPVSRGLLQRKCACGGEKGLSGECAECRRKRRLGLQPTLTVGRPADRYEQEANRVADQILGAPAPGARRMRPLTPVVQRDADPEAVATAPSIVSDVLATPGRPLDTATRASMEARLGYDFGRVRVHTEARAAEAARAVRARAFTVGRDVVFAAGRYAPRVAAGRRLLAHELAHVAQQGQASLRSTTAPGSALLQRAPEEPGVPSPDAEPDPRAAVERAALLCDILTLCRIRRENPGAVTDERVRTVTRRCRPWVSSSIPPCLNPAATLPLSELTGSPGPTPTGQPSGSASGGPDLSGLTKFEFNLGDANFAVDLPSSATARLPVELSRALRLTFTLKTETAGKFTFSITLDGVPHVRISASTTLDVAGKRGTGSLSITSARRVCHAPNALETKTALEGAGNKLKEAMLAYNQPIESTANEVIERAERIGDIVGGIAAVHRAVEKAKGKCETTSAVSFGVTSQFPIERGSETTPSVGVGLRVHF